MEQSVLLDIVSRNPVNRAILERLPALGLPDAWLVSGCLFQSVWNHQTGRPIAHGIRDYDLFYFDPDTRYEAEDAVIKRCERAFEGVGGRVEVRNQARVHLWFPQKFGQPYPPLQRACDGIDRFLATACMIGLQPQRHGPPRVYAPAGLHDLAGLRLRPNRTPSFSAAAYHQKAQRWQAVWPELAVSPA